MRERLVKTGSLDDFVYLQGFWQEYKIFCIDKELAVIGDKIDVKGRHLASQLACQPRACPAHLQSKVAQQQ